jgi:hypothetical protein
VLHIFYSPGTYVHSIPLTQVPFLTKGFFFLQFRDIEKFLARIFKKLEKLGEFRLEKISKIFPIFLKKKLSENDRLTIPKEVS